MAAARPAQGARLDRDRSLLLIIDIQERLAPHIAQHEALVARVQALLATAQRLRVPALLTEHCAAQIGPVIAPLRTQFAAEMIFGKTCFAATEHPEFVSLVQRQQRPQLVVAGMEAHVCVLQTVLGLVGLQYDVFLIGDAVGSRGERTADRQFALERMAGAGCTLVGTETVLFEWTRAGDDPAFREVLTLVKSLPA